ISDHTQGNWNGIVGSMFLESTPQVFIQDIRIFPDLVNRKARIKMLIANRSGAKVSGEVRLSAKSFNVVKNHETVPLSARFTAAQSDSTELDLELPFGEGMLTWDEFEPALYKLKATLLSKGLSTEKQV